MQKTERPAGFLQTETLRSTLPSHDQLAAVVRDRDDRLGAGVEFEMVGLDAVAEDDAVFRHQRSQPEFGSARNLAERQLGFRRLARKRLAHRKLQVIAIP